MDRPLKRISLLIREEQYKGLSEKGINVSGLIRDLIDDHLSEYKITLGVTEKTRNLYDKIIANTGSSDQDLEVYFREALEGLLEDKIRQIQSLRQEFNESKKP